MKNYERDDPFKNELDKCEQELAELDQLEAQSGSLTDEQQARKTFVLEQRQTLLDAGVV